MGVEVDDATENHVPDPVEEHAEDEFGIARSRRSTDPVGEKGEQRSERRTQFGIVALREPEVFASEYARVPGGSRQSEQSEQFRHERTQCAGARTVAEPLGEQSGSDAAVGGEQGDQEIVLAPEAPVEGLERTPRPCRHLGHGECGITVLVGEVARGVDEKVGSGP